MESKFDLIEKYLMNEMSVREQIEFEELLRNEPDLMKEFLLRKNINDAIIEEDVLSLRNNLNEIVNIEPATTRTIKNSYIYSAVAAVIILIVVIANFYIFPLGQMDKNEVFQSYYSAYPAILSFRSPVDQTEIEKILYHAFNYYDDGKYEMASGYFKMVLEKDTANYMSQFYLAVCEIEKNNLSEAEEYLNDLILKKSHIFWEQSHWYLALVYLKQNEMISAENILKKIVKENMVQKSDAEFILKVLN
ncbi:MAG: tetratricopeptide repeat protein [Bacteroidales bacterium]|nr:tetratricopeptide repeat protein [Bacteroidales bacterium]